MELKDGIKTFRAKTRKDWRKWLEKNHQSERSVWLILAHKHSKTPGIRYEEAVEEALCFGWVDSKAKKRDHESSYRYFSQRKPKSNWSESNRNRVAKLIRQGLMTESGQKMIDLAKKTGTWEALDDIQNVVIPDDLQKLFDKSKTALKNFNAFSPSSKRMILGWIMMAKRPETRQKRIKETVKLAKRNIKAQ